MFIINPFIINFLFRQSMHSLTFSITLFSIVQLYLKRLQKTQNKKQVNKKAFFSQNENKYFLVYMLSIPWEKRHMD